MDSNERAAWLRLTLTPGVGAAAARKLLATFGLPNAVLDAGFTALANEVGEPLARALTAAPPAEIAQAVGAAERWLAQDERNALVTLADADYPRALLSTVDPPPVLFVRGRRELLNRPAFAIVGSRSATKQGTVNAEAFAHALARAGLTIVSGLALGIDAAAHRGALRALDEGADASTIAVVGTGADVIYPATNRLLTDAVASRGVIVSELPLGAPPLAHHFPRRNRIIAGLARGVLVVEAALRSGSLITARLAAENGRDVFALPGSIHAPLAKGCHRLIKDGAKLVDAVADVLDELRMSAPANPPAARGAAGDGALPAAQRAVLDALGFDPLDLDTLIVRMQADTGTLTAALLELELAQYVDRLPGNRYQRLR
jgi:DNA processing protein